MTYLQGDIDKPETWSISYSRLISDKELIMGFTSRREARAWVLKELRTRVKVINAVISIWMHEGAVSDKTATEIST